MSDHGQCIETNSAADTRQFGRTLAKMLKAGDILALHGDLGAGKTCLVQGLAQALGAVEDVSSPTFTLINEYHGALPLYHFDLYRLKTAQELEDIGCDEYFYGDGICVLEWADRAGRLLPEYHWKVVFDIKSGDQRCLWLYPPQEKGTA